MKLHATKMSPDMRYTYLHQPCTATKWWQCSTTNLKFIST